MILSVIWKYWQTSNENFCSPIIHEKFLTAILKSTTDTSKHLISRSLQAITIMQENQKEKQKFWWRIIRFNDL